MKRLVVAVAAVSGAMAAGGPAPAQEASVAMEWGRITGVVYGAAVQCGIGEQQQQRFLDAVSAKIALNALSHDDRRAAAEAFIQGKRSSGGEPAQGCLDLRQGFEELVHKLKSTSYGWQWQEIASEKLEAR